MKRILSIVILILLSFSFNNSYSQFQSKPINQQPAPKPATQTTAKPATAVQKLPSPYLLKKDFEDKMSSVNSQINAIQGSTSSLRGDVEAKLQTITELQTKMTNVEDILNSANFKISTTSDSLKLTNSSMEEFRASTEVQLKKLEEADKKINLVWAGVAVSIVLISLVFFALNSKIAKLKSELKKQTDLANVKLAEELKSDMHHSQSKMSKDLTHLKSELQHKMKEDHESLNTQLQSIIDKLENTNNGNEAS